MFVVRTNAERSVEILRHRTDVQRTDIIRVTPAGDRQSSNFLQDCFHLNGLESALYVAIAGADEGAVDKETECVQAHQFRAAAGVEVAVVMGATPVPREPVEHRSAVASRIEDSALHTHAIYVPPQVQHLARGTAEGDAGGVVTQPQTPRCADTKLI